MTVANHSSEALCAVCGRERCDWPSGCPNMIACNKCHDDCFERQRAEVARLRPALEHCESWFAGRVPRMCPPSDMLSMVRAALAAPTVAKVGTVIVVDPNASAPWPLWSVVAQLARAVEHSLDAHSCDHYGYENDREAVIAANALLAANGRAALLVANEPSVTAPTVPAKAEVPAALEWVEADRGGWGRLELLGGAYVVVTGSVVTKPDYGDVSITVPAATYAAAKAEAERIARAAGLLPPPAATHPTGTVVDEPAEPEKEQGR